MARAKRALVGLAAALVGWTGALPAAAQSPQFQSPQFGATASEGAPGAFCHLPASAIAEDEQLRRRAAAGDATARSAYAQRVQERAAALTRCRTTTWPQTQAVWLRLYPCDLQPGVLEGVLDRIVALGYNRVLVEVFYDGQVLLPSGNNPTVWPSAIRVPGAENTDLLARTIQLGRARGLSVYAWMFSMNFGYSYGQRPDRQNALARNRLGQSSLQQPTLNDGTPDVSGTTDQVFVDPYSPQARADLAQLVQAVLQRRPDGVLFDYIRYPKSSGAASIVTSAKNLWIYGESSWEQIFGRVFNRRGQELLYRFLVNGFVTVNDVQVAAQQNPADREPLWQGSQPPQPVATTNNLVRANSGGVNTGTGTTLGSSLPATTPPPSNPAQDQARFQRELWNLAVEHARQGVVSFLTAASQPVLQQGISAGAVFFPEANRSIGRGFDSRLQPWDQFPPSLEWHPMSYAICGTTSCIVDQVGKVRAAAPQGTQVIPALAGRWGQVQGRPSLEDQMQALQRAYPDLKAVSHFSYAWLDPQADAQRRSCRVQAAR
ncbi:family 10 glycosylhydrolase [Leptolyngbya sp. FACHB-261]|uniref:family 10 glycosylhydrolase n=1 Tax=Leptolyngbya sp. FACHB-261 TaxID=2692806 RepID=UPI0016858154|nr:family 10 glycosylhydrolase [Leptolyngbya sp. FACHB-261]MBD2099599.1 family 10 glycosylhydrolase [Leptolyngbya sp. FACHB-261]